jgi:hypothetical protein
LPLQFGVQQAPPTHTPPTPHLQSAGQFVQFSPSLHTLSPHCTHWNVASQVLPMGHVPQTEPQPSAPHSFPLHSGVQHVPAGVQLPCMHWQSCWQMLQSSPSSQIWFPQLACWMHWPVSLQT